MNKVFYACLYGNSESYLLIRELNRDLELESEMIYVEQDFWENHVLKGVPPPYIEEGDLIIESARRHFGNADTSASPVSFCAETLNYVARYLELTEQKTQIDIATKHIENDIKRLKGLIISEMGNSCTACFSLEDTPYIVTYNPVYKIGISKASLARLKGQYPDIYNEYVTVSESRRFNISIGKNGKEAA